MTGAHRDLRYLYRLPTREVPEFRETACKQCGCTFTVSPRPGRPQKYCTAECRRKSAAQISLARAREVPCSVCGAPCSREGYHFCSGKCANEHRRRRLIESRRTTCQICGGEFTQKPFKGGMTQTCSHKCAGELARITRSAESQARRTRPCSWCGRDFVAPFGGGSNYAKGQSTAVFCSPPCRDKALHSEFANKQQEDAHRDLFGEIDVECPVCKTAVLRLLGAEAGGIFCSAKCLLIHRHQIDKVAKTGGHFLDPDIVFERDDWHCYLCKQETPRALRGTTAPNAPEIEHVIPLSAGGAHTYENVRCACRRCNQIKGAKPLSQFWMNFAEIELIGRF